MTRPSRRAHPAPDDDDGPDPLPRSARPPRGRVSVEEYLAFERRHPARHEYVDGYVYAMTGARLAHNRIVGNLVFRLMTLAGEGPCHVYFEAAKLRVGDDFYYPDVMVVCDPAGVEDDEDPEFAHGPCLLAEVLSPRTARIDRTQKLERYRTLPSLRAYLIVGRRERHVVRHWRDAADAPWRRDEYAGRGEIPLPCPAAGPGPGVLTLDQVYRGIAFGPRLRRLREPAPGAPPAAPAGAGA
jgi:Uma2 family endonuclease